MPGTQLKIPIWLDCDPGHDDAFAILLAAHHPSLELLGISTIHGNASVENTTENARRILIAIGRPDIPVYRGSSRPFSRNPLHAADIHGESGLDGTELLPPLPPPSTHSDVADSPAAEIDGGAIIAMRDAITKHPKGTVWVVATGTWTNVALLFASFPDVAHAVAGVSLMGGAIGEGYSDARMSKLENGVFKERIGNTTRWAEFNVYCDPESARSLLRNPLLQGKLIINGLDITHLVLASGDVQRRLLHGDLERNTSDNTPHPMRQMFSDLLNFFAATYRDVFGFTDGPPLHDPLAVAAVLDRVRAETFGLETAEKPDGQDQQWMMDVITDGEHVGGGSDVNGDAAQSHQQDGNLSQLGRTILVKKTGSGVLVPRRIVHQDRFWDAIERAMQSAEQACAGTNVWRR